MSFLKPDKRTGLVLSAVLGVVAQLVFVVGRRDLESFAFVVFLIAVFLAARLRGSKVPTDKRLPTLFGAMAMTELAVIILTRL